jgi:hypothetical protein
MSKGREVDDSRALFVRKEVDFAEFDAVIRSGSDFYISLMDLL